MSHAQQIIEELQASNVALKAEVAALQKTLSDYTRRDVASPLVMSEVVQNQKEEIRRLLTDMHRLAAQYDALQLQKGKAT